MFVKYFIDKSKDYKLNGEWMNNWFEKDGGTSAFKPRFQQLGSTETMNTDKTATKLSS
jgi:hypothetical protein